MSTQTPQTRKRKEDKEGLLEIAKKQSLGEVKEFLEETTEKSKEKEEEKNIDD